MRRTWKAFTRILLEILGWLLVVLGIAALFLPGPGLLMLLAGLVVLSQQYEWAERRVDPLAAKAFEVAKQGVSTWPRIIMSGVGALCVIAAGVVWWIAPTIPEFWIVGPEWPLGGWATGSSIVISGFIALGLLIYSVIRWRHEAKAERRAAKAERSKAHVSS
ncbi:MAG: PGPGW domain-containing protein [Nocardioidaceae bacterium]